MEALLEALRAGVCRAPPGTQGLAPFGLLTLRPASGITETLRTEQETSIKGRQMIERARSLEGRRVPVHRYDEPKAGGKFENVRVVAHLLGLGAPSPTTSPARSS
ncbi:hypothetical protein [Streptomyces sp. NPDC091209]|uniref:hypothetical protein n=1 Tax=Streptomyces sp. NPDC091209 TaxID=3365974 RepID=UPI003803721E